MIGQKQKVVVMAGWDDVPHLTEESKAKMLAGTPPHLRDSRSKGIPGLGSGAIYPISEDDIKFDIMEIPPWFRRSYGMDVGWNATAVVFGAYDPENDIAYIYDAYKRGQAEPDVHASAIRKRYPGGFKLTGCIDPASSGSGQADGKQLMLLYRQEGLRLVPAENAVEAGIAAVYSRLSTGRLKIARHLSDIFDEYRIYRRNENGKIVKEHDHYMDALRYYVMSGLKIAKPIKTQQVRHAGGRKYF
jgi:hypothetical protein